MWSQSNDELRVQPQDGVDSFSLFPSRDRLSWNSSPLFSYCSPSSSVIGPQPKKKKTEAVSNIRKQLRDCLNNVHNGSFATSSALPNAADPALFVPSLGGVGRPMSEREVEAIFDMVHKVWNQADHPEGTVSPRAGACELTPNRFKIRNPAWQQT